jgi:hypothetical protein
MYNPLEQGELRNSRSCGYRVITTVPIRLIGRLHLIGRP